MTDWREELVEQMAKAAWESDGAGCRWEIVVQESVRNGWLREARAALAVAEPAIREQCARMADAIAKDYRVYRDHFSHSEPYTSEQIAAETAERVAAAIREGGKDA